MNHCEFKMSNHRDSKNFPVLEMRIVDGNNEVLDTSFIMPGRDYDCLDVYTSTQCQCGHSPYASKLYRCFGVIGKKESLVALRGQLMLAIADHLYIIRDLLKIDTELPNIGGRFERKDIDSFVEAVYEVIRSVT